MSRKKEGPLDTVKRRIIQADKDCEDMKLLINYSFIFIIVVIILLFALAVTERNRVLSMEEGISFLILILVSVLAIYGVEKHLFGSQGGN